MPTLDTGEVTIHYRSRGNGWPLVFLHGGWLDGDLWRPQLEHFADDFRVVTVDCRGHGESGDGDEYGIDVLADDLEALLDGLGLANPVVVGLSMGGLVAQQFAADHPDRVAGLVLASTVTSVPPIPMTDLQKHLLVPKPGYHAAVRTMGPRAYFRMLLNWVESLEGRWLAETPEAREYALDAVGGFGADGFLQVLDALYEFEAPDLPEVPAAVVHGDGEAGPVVRHCDALADRLDAPRTVVPDAAHLANRDNPAAFNGALAEFLDEQVTVSV
ncbi:alpha/beta hydrolase [Halobacteriales archaeon QS_1_68_20]|nr:MAG: alpha/beta hydrolase [Halobacteriales archaeon QS_1_68_20]